METANKEFRKEVITFLNDNNVYDEHYSYEDEEENHVYGDDDVARDFMEEKGLTPEQIKLALNILDDWRDDDNDDRDSEESEFKSLTGYDSPADFYGV